MVEKERAVLLAPLRSLPLAEERRLLQEETARLLAPLDVASQLAKAEAGAAPALAPSPASTHTVSPAAEAKAAKPASDAKAAKPASAPAPQGPKAVRKNGKGGNLKMGDKQASADLMGYFDGLIRRRIAVANHPARPRA